MTTNEHALIAATVATLQPHCTNVSTAGLFEVATGLVKRGAIGLRTDGVAYLQSGERAGRSYEWAQRILDGSAPSIAPAPPPLHPDASPAARTVEELRRRGLSPWIDDSEGGNIGPDGQNCNAAMRALNEAGGGDLGLVQNVPEPDGDALARSVAALRALGIEGALS